GVFRNAPLFGVNGRVHGVGFGLADSLPFTAHGTCGFTHQPSECNHRHIAGANSFFRAIANRAHRLPHCDILIWNTADACEIALLHRGAVLPVEIGARTDAVKVTVDVDTPLQHIEFTPGIGIDPGLVGTIPRDE